jgi:hypothetical protein
MRAQIERRALEMQKQAAATTPANKIPPTVKPVTTGPKPPKKAQYSPGEIEAISQQKGDDIAVVAIISKVKLSGTGKSLYLDFEGDAPVKVMGRYVTHLGEEGMSVSELGVLEGKRVRIQGKVVQEFGSNRWLIDIKTRAQITQEAAP